MILFAIGLFFFDFITFGLLDTWVTYTLLMFFIYQLVLVKNYLSLQHYCVLILLFLQDLIIAERFAASALYVVPLIAISPKIRLMLQEESMVPYLVMFLFSILIYFTAFSQIVSVESILIVISINMGVFVSFLRIRKL